MMQGTAPLFAYPPSRTMSRLGAICLPIEQQLRDTRSVQTALDREVRAHSTQGPLFVKCGQARLFRSDASRRLHREAAWDIARAALRSDMGGALCATAPGLVDHAWSFSGMPQRGQPITLRQVMRLASLTDYLAVGQLPEATDGTPASRLRACQGFAAALDQFRTGAGRGAPTEPAADDRRTEVVVHTVVHVMDESGEGAREARHTTRTGSQRATQAASHTPSRAASQTASQTASHTASQAASPDRWGPDRPASSPGVAQAPWYPDDAGPSRQDFASPSHRQSGGLGWSPEVTPHFRRLARHERNQAYSSHAQSLSPDRQRLHTLRAQQAAVESGASPAPMASLASPASGVASRSDVVSPSRLEGNAD